MSQIEIDTARFDELDTLIALMADSFGLPGQAARDVFYADPYFAIENKRVLRVEGRLVSCLTIIETQCWLGAGVVRLAGIAGVATLPEERGKGYARLLLENTIPLLRERGYALSALFPFSYPYYRKLGWERAGFAARYLTLPTNLPPFPEYKNVREAAIEDIPSLEIIYNATATGKPLRCLRDKKRWRYVLDNARQRVVYSPDGTVVEGYLLFERREIALPDSPEMTLPPTLRILELNAVSPEAKRGLIGWLAAQRDYAAIEYDAARDEIAETGLLEPVGPEGDSLASMDIVPAVMVRVLDFGKLVEVLSAGWGGEAGTLVLVAHDAFPAPKGEAVLLTFSPDRAIPRPLSLSKAADYADRLEADVRVWAQVLTGHLSGDNALALRGLQASSVRAAELAGHLFPLQDPYIPLADHF